MLPRRCVLCDAAILLPNDHAPVGIEDRWGHSRRGRIHDCDVKR